MVPDLSQQLEAFPPGNTRMHRTFPIPTLPSSLNQSSLKKAKQKKGPCAQHAPVFHNKTPTPPPEFQVTRPWDLMCQQWASGSSCTPTCGRLLMLAGRPEIRHLCFWKPQPNVHPNKTQRPMAAVPGAPHMDSVESGHFHPASHRRGLDGATLGTGLGAHICHVCPPRSILCPA